MALYLPSMLFTLLAPKLFDQFKVFCIGSVLFLIDLPNQLLNELLLFIKDFMTFMVMMMTFNFNPFMRGRLSDQNTQFLFQFKDLYLQRMNMFFIFGDNLLFFFKPPCIRGLHFIESLEFLGYIS